MLQSPKKTKSNLLWMFLTLLALLGCARKENHQQNHQQCNDQICQCPFSPKQLNSFGNPNDASDIIMDLTVPVSQRSLLRSDLQLLAGLNLSGSNYDRCIIGVQDFQASTLAQYLKTRVRFIVGKNFDYEQAIVQRRGSNNHPTLYAEHFPSLSSFNEIITIMTNIGAFLYLVGKKHQLIYTIRLDQQNVDIMSPRVGIIQIGEGLFTQRVKSSSLDSWAHSFMRLSTLFHEARHSDGNGDHTGFPHHQCPEGPYRGAHACEDNLNGPYAAQIVFLKKFIEICSRCSTQELEGMKLTLADYQSRLLPTAQFRDDSPEGFPK